MIQIILLVIKSLRYIRLSWISNQFDFLVQPVVLRQADPFIGQRLFNVNPTTTTVETLKEKPKLTISVEPKTLILKDRSRKNY